MFEAILDAMLDASSLDLRIGVDSLAQRTDLCVAAFCLLLGLLGELQRCCFTITAAGTTTVGRRSSHSGRVHHILCHR